MSVYLLGFFRTGNTFLASSYAELYSQPSQIFKMELFAKIVNTWKPLTIFAKNSILDIWQGSEYVSMDLSYYSYISLIF